MDGLECSEILLSETLIDNEKNRLDSDFFKKKYLAAYDAIKSIKHSTIGDDISVLTDFHSNGSYESIASVFKLLDTPDYAYMVRTTDLESENYTENVKYVNKETYEFLEKSKVFGGEVIINKIGSPGRTFLMPKLGIPVSLGMNLFMLRTKIDSHIDNVLLYVFLNTKLGKTLIERKVNGTVPLTIDKNAIRSIYTPCFFENFKNAINDIVDSHQKLLAKSREEYDGALKKLNEIFNINTNCETGIINSQKLLSESFDVYGRLDAEYYHPKYDVLFDRLKEFDCDPLGGSSGICNIKKSIEPGSEAYQEEGIPFIRVSDIDKYGIAQPEIHLSADIVENIDELYPQKDTILLSKDGSVGVSYKVREDMKAITSGALLHLTVKDKTKVLPDYLTLILNSPVVQLQAERDTNGAIIQHWKPSEIEKVLIPILDMDIQEDIAQKVQESFVLRKKSKELLEYAKQAVEMAIEQGEDKALEWLKNKEI